MNQSNTESVRDVECVESSSTIKHSSPLPAAPGEDDPTLNKDRRRIAGPLDICLMSKRTPNHQYTECYSQLTLFYVQIWVLCCRM